MGDAPTTDGTPTQGYFDYLWDSAIGAVDYIGTSIQRLVGYEDLDVINPESGEAEHGTTDAEDQRQTAFADYKRYVGQDITSLVALPLWIMEPYTMLQKVAEIMEYSDILDRANAEEDPDLRMALVTAFCLGPFGANERTWKPFNPILGETFEVDMENGARFLAEQVSHHPPVGAAHAENDNWTYDIVSAPTTKFLGNAVDIYPVGRSRMELRRTGEVYSLVPPNSKAHNLIVGRTWVDCYGDFKLLNVTTGARCSLYFQPCGWFGSGRYQVSGHVYNPEGQKVLYMSGAWNSHLEYQRCDPEGNPLPDEAPVRVWQCKEKPEGDKYGFTYFSRRLNDGKGVAPLPSDSRRRPDRHALAEGDRSTAGTLKHTLEEMQRAEARARKEKSDSWMPRWFRKPAEEVAYDHEYSAEECPFWEFTGDYYNLERAPAGTSEDCGGKDFNPWQYPKLHGLAS
eukprot:jgi/Botrbrau1/16032/Bobra.7_2s0006.1